MDVPTFQFRMNIDSLGGYHQVCQSLQRLQQFSKGLSHGSAVRKRLQVLDNRQLWELAADINNVIGTLAELPQAYDQPVQIQGQCALAGQPPQPDQGKYPVCTIYVSMTAHG